MQILKKVWRYQVIHFWFDDLVYQILVKSRGIGKEQDLDLSQPLSNIQE